MADLTTIIRVKKYELDEKQKALGELNAVYNRLTERLENLEKERAAEEKTAQSITDGQERLDFQMAYQNYLSGYKMRRTGIETAMNSLNEKIEIAMDEIRDAFAELKRFETIHENRQQEKRDLQKRKEEQELDEIALENFRRKENES